MERSKTEANESKAKQSVQRSSIEREIGGRRERWWSLVREKEKVVLICLKK